MKTIALSANYAYLNNAETTIKSIMYNVKNVKIYLLNYDIPQEWFININKYAAQIGDRIVDQKFNPDILSDLHGPRQHINKMTFARFLIPKLISEERVLYLDSDLVVDSNIDKLFSIPFEGKKLLAAPDIFDSHDVPGQKNDCLINAGVLVLNNKLLKEDSDLTTKLLKLSHQNCINGDQGVINDYFKGEIGILPHTYNHQIGGDYIAFWKENKRMQQLLDEVKKPKIIHYIMANKPSDFTSTCRLRDRWWFYRNLELAYIVQKFTVFDLSKIKQSSYEKEALIFTYSANIKSLEELAQKLPMLHFNVAAYTQMAWELLELSKYSNITLYPTITGMMLSELINRTDLYLDINFESKEETVLKKIVEKNIPILSFEETADKNNAYSNYTVFGNDQVDQMVEKIKEIMTCKK